MSERRFAVFILSYGRCDDVITIKTLRTQGYTGPIIILTEKSQYDDYVQAMKDEAGVTVHYYVMDEARVFTDLMDNRPGGSICPARNHSFILAEQLGYTHFLMFEDDYMEVDFRFPLKKDTGWVLTGRKVRNLDRLFDMMMDFLDSTPIYTICFAQGGDYIGGVEKFREGSWGNKLRKAMNSFFLRTDRPFKFIGRMNDDVNAYSTEGCRGGLFLTFRNVAIEQRTTQANKGGLTEMYLQNGTYVKSFYSVMCQPSCTKVIMMSTSHKRIHHLVEFEYCVPKILPQSFKKSENRITPIVYEHEFDRSSKI